jgi:3-oxoadipate enol-lactonase
MRLGGGVTLAYDETGAGPPVLLLHSTACDRRMWDPQVPALAAAGHRVVRCDLRGYGDSPVPTAPWSNAGDVAELLDELDIAAAAVVGASGGGRVALEFASRWPVRVTALALLCSALPGHPPSDALRAFGDREDALLAAGDVDRAVRLNVDTWVGPAASADTRSLVTAMQRHAFDVQLAGPDDVAEEHTEITLPAVDMPALVVSGAHDLVDFREIAVLLADRLPTARLVELDWAGHLPSLERPELMNPLLTGFLAGSSPR